MSCLKIKEMSGENNDYESVIWLRLKRFCGIEEGSVVNDYRGF